MSLYKYAVDTRSLSEEDREKLLELLDRCTETGANFTETRFVFSFFLDEKINPETIPGIPAHLLRRVP